MGHDAEMLDDEDRLSISAIEHYAYCPRQMAFISMEQVWQENMFTVQGSAQHERVHRYEQRVERGVLVVRAMTLWSENLSLYGKADVVEFVDGLPVPVEHKLNASHDAAEQQLCAQAFCLEEMFSCEISAAYLSDRSSGRRRTVKLDEGLRSRTKATIAAARELLASGVLPAPVADERCRACSMKNICLPGVARRPDADT